MAALAGRGAAASPYEPWTDNSDLQTATTVFIIVSLVGALVIGTATGVLALARGMDASKDGW